MLPISAVGFQQGERKARRQGSEWKPAEITAKLTDSAASPYGTGSPYKDSN